jgi:hypothetical protein
MSLIRRSGSALLIAAAMSLPTLASAEQAPSELCDGMKQADKQQQQQAPTADRSNQSEDKSKQKSDDKSDSKSNDKPSASQTPRQS